MSKDEFSSPVDTPEGWVRRWNGFAKAVKAVGEKKMKTIAQLKREATESAHLRNHVIGWSIVRVDSHDSEKQTCLGTCIRCGAWVQIETKPAPNSIEIGGPAVATNCGDQ